MLKLGNEITYILSIKPSQFKNNMKDDDYLIGQISQHNLQTLKSYIYETSGIHILKIKWKLSQHIF